MAAIRTNRMEQIRSLFERDKQHGLIERGDAETIEQVVALMAISPLFKGLIDNEVDERRQDTSTSKKKAKLYR